MESVTIFLHSLGLTECPPLFEGLGGLEAGGVRPGGVHCGLVRGIAGAGHVVTAAVEEGRAEWTV